MTEPSALIANGVPSVKVPGSPRLVITPETQRTGKIDVPFEKLTPAMTEPSALTRNALEFRYPASVPRFTVPPAAVHW
jgi:hypothetical protein